MGSRSFDFAQYKQLSKRGTWNRGQDNSEPQRSQLRLSCFCDRDLWRLTQDRLLVRPPFRRHLLSACLPFTFSSPRWPCSFLGIICFASGKGDSRIRSAPSEIAIRQETCAFVEEPFLQRLWPSVEAVTLAHSSCASSNSKQPGRARRAEKSEGRESPGSDSIPPHMSDCRWRTCCMRNRIREK